MEGVEHVASSTARSAAAATTAQQTYNLRHQHRQIYQLMVALFVLMAPRLLSRPFNGGGGHGLIGIGHSQTTKTATY